MRSTTTKKDREYPSSFRGRFGINGGLEFGSYIKASLKNFMKDNPNMAFELKPLVPESKHQRGYFEGGVCALMTYFQEGMDYRNYKDINKVREWFKIEFNGDYVEIGGKSHKVAKSTKGELNLGFLERVIGYMEDNYGLNPEALNPERYKKWRDTIHPFGGPDNYIDYLRDIRLI